MATIRKFPRIYPNSSACIVAPSYGPSSPDNVTMLIRNVTEIVNLHNLVPIFNQGFLAPESHPLFDPAKLRFANTDKQRLNYFYSALNNKNCTVIWAESGGYGSIKIFENLAQLPPPENIKPFIGFSDITTLHVLFNFVWKMPSIHAPMPGTLQSYSKDPVNIAKLQEVLFIKETDILNYKLYPITPHIDISVKINGTTCGGNKLTFDRLLTTTFDINLKDKILLLEDVGETASWLYSFLEGLSLRNDFNNIAAVIFGSFLPVENYGIFERIYEDFASHTSFPVFKMDSNDTIGHDHRNAAIVLGTNGIIHFNGTNEIFYLTIKASDFMYGD